MSSLKVPVGVTSVAGYTVTLAGVVGAVLAFLKGDRSDQTLGVLASAGLAILAFLSTQLGRYVQAHALVKTAPVLAEQARWTSMDQDKQVSVDEVVAKYDELAAADAFEQGTGEDPPPESDLYPLTDPRNIPPDVGDGDSEGSA
jgi:predicted cation transporter